MCPIFPYSFLFFFHVLPRAIENVRYGGNGQGLKGLEVLSEIMFMLSQVIQAGTPTDSIGPKTGSIGPKNPKIRVLIIIAFLGFFMVILGLNNILIVLIGFFRFGLA